MKLKTLLKYFLSFVLEVNSSPGLEGIEAVSQKDIAGLLIKHIERKLKFKRKIVTKN